MASLQPHYENDSPNTIAALGLRWSALRGMLGSPLIETDDQKPLREELLKELQSVGQGMSEVAARNAIELCAKIDVMSEELKKATGSDDSSRTLLASIRKDVMLLIPRTVAAERSNVQLVRGQAPHRTVEPSPADALRGGAA